MDSIHKRRMPSSTPFSSTATGLWERFKMGDTWATGNQSYEALYILNVTYKYLLRIALSVSGDEKKSAKMAVPAVTLMNGCHTLCAASELV